MRYLFALLLLAALVYGGWPYFEYYRLDQALAGSDDRQLEQYLDLEAIRAAQASASELGLQRQLPGQDLLSGAVREGARMLNRATGEEITLAAVRSRLQGAGPTAGEPARSLVAQTDFAFFESPTRFVARLGRLEGTPTFVELTMRDWRWRVTGIHACGP
jgi:hypothetical protein